MRYALIKRCIAAVMLLVIWTGLSIPPVSAGDGDGSGSGGGTSGAKPLKFMSATLVDEQMSIVDAAEIPLKPKFRLLFDKNVVNIAVWGINRECFKLLSSDNGAVPIEVTKVDDTIDPSQRQAVFVEPINALAPGESYSLKIAPELTAKNGVSTLGGTTSGRGVTIVFTTKREEQAQAPSVPVKEEATAAPSPTAASAPAGQKVESSANPEASDIPKAASGQKIMAPVASTSQGAGESGTTRSDQTSTAGKAAGSGTAGSGTAASAAGHKSAGSTAAASEAAQMVQPAAQENLTPAVATPAAASASPQRPEVTEAPAAVAAQPGNIPKPSAKAVAGEAAVAVAQPEAAAALSDTASSDSHWRLMMIVLVVLAAGWTSAEMLYFRRRRAGKRPGHRNDS